MESIRCLALDGKGQLAWTQQRYFRAVEHPLPVDQLRAQGVPVKDEEVARLSPLGHAHINFPGGYAITVYAPAQSLRPLSEVPDLPVSAS